MGHDRSWLTCFEKLVFWLVVFHRFRGRGLIKHAADLFGLEAETARQLHATLTSVMGRFFQGQQPAATRKQAAAGVSAKSRCNLRLQDGHALFIGDCTERFIDDAKGGALHSVTHSDCEKHTTAKHLLIVLGDDCLSFMPPAFAGAASDNATHTKAGVPNVLWQKCCDYIRQRHIEPPLSCARVFGAPQARGTMPKKIVDCALRLLHGVPNVP